MTAPPQVKGNLTLYGYDELRHHREDPLGPALGQEVLNTVGGQEHVGVVSLSEPVEQQGKVVVVVQTVDRHLGNLESFFLPGPDSLYGTYQI